VRGGLTWICAAVTAVVTRPPPRARAEYRLTNAARALCMWQSWIVVKWMRFIDLLVVLGEGEEPL
jgi:hypothetical protein